MRSPFLVRWLDRRNKHANQTKRDEMKCRIRQVFTIATARTILKELHLSIEDQQLVVPARCIGNTRDGKHLMDGP